MPRTFSPVKMHEEIRAGISEQSPRGISKTFQHKNPGNISEK